MKISRRTAPEDLFTVTGLGTEMRWLRIDGVNVELSLTAEDADVLSEFFASLAAAMGREAAS